MDLNDPEDITDHLGAEDDAEWAAMTEWPDERLARVLAVLQSTDEQVRRELKTRKAEMAEARDDAEKGVITWAAFRAQEVEFRSWRRPTHRFHGMVAARMRQVRTEQENRARLAHERQFHEAQRRRAERAALTSEQDRAASKAHREALRRLAVAVAAHQAAAAGRFPWAEDRALWAVLADLTVPHGGDGATATVRELIDTGQWTPDPTKPE